MKLMRRLTRPSGGRASALPWAMAILFTLPACEKKEGYQAVPPRPIAWATAESHTGEVIRVLTGVTQPRLQTPLSFEVSGVVEDVWVDVGQRVSVGQSLAVLNPETFLLELQLARNAHGEIEVALKQANIDLVRQKELRSKRLNAVHQLDMAQLHRDQLVKRIAALQARLKGVEKNLRDTRLRAPYSGVITERVVEPGQQITQGQKVFHIESDTGQEVAVRVPEGLLNLLRVGSEHRIKIPAASAGWIDAYVAEISTQPTHTNAYPATLVLKNISSEVKSGMTAEVRLHLKRNDSTRFSNAGRVSIPISSLLMDAGNSATVFRYDPETGLLVAVPVTIGEFIEDRVEVTRGLSQGDIVASKGINHLRDGQRVSLMGTGVVRYNP